MRELVFKNLTSEDKKKKDLFITETIDREGMRTVTQRHSTYMVSNRKTFASHSGLEEWQKKVPAYNKRHVFVFKKRNTKEKKDSFICDVVGKFYAVVKKDVYSIAFKHSFEIDFLPVNKF